MRNLSRIRRSLLSAVGALGLVGAAFVPAALADDPPPEADAPYQVQGTVTVPEGYSIENVTVTADYADEDEENPTETDPVEAVVTPVAESNGTEATFEFEVAVDGEWWVTAESDEVVDDIGLSAAWTWFDTAEDADENGLIELDPLDMSKAPFAISGKVVVPEGFKAADVEVTAWSADDDMGWDSVIPDEEVDTEGVFTLWLGEGEWEITAALWEDTLLWGEPVLTSETRAVEVTDNAELEEVFELVKLPDVKFGLFPVFGQVTAPEGVDVEGISVEATELDELEEEAAASASDKPLGYVEETTTDEDGNFTLALLEGNYEITFSGAGIEESVEEVELSWDHWPTWVYLGTVELTELPPPEAYMVKGEVTVPEGYLAEKVDATAVLLDDEGEPTGEPVEGTIAVHPQDETRGALSFELTPGSWQITVASSQEGLTVVKYSVLVVDEDVDIDTILSLQKEVRPELEVDRVWGKNRYETNYKLVKETLQEGDTVFVVTGQNYADALSAAPAAALTDGVLVLTRPAALADDMLKLIKDTKVGDVYIIGGKDAVSENVRKQISDATDKDAKRVGGTTRYGTSENVLNVFFVEPKDVAFDTAFVATGKDFPDALSASAAAGAVGAPVVLVKGTSQTQLTKTMAAAFDAEKVTDIKLVGGTSVVSKTLKTNLEKKNFKVDRLSGDNRYQTNLAVNQFLLKDTVVPTGMWIATGKLFPDALSAAVPAGENDQLLVLSNGTCVMKEAVDWAKGDDSLVEKVTLVGGTQALSDAVFKLEPCK